MGDIALYLGVDGGGTHCRARLYRPGKGVIGEGAAGPANLRFGVKESFAAVLAAARESFAAAGLPFDRIGRTTACVALAGASEPACLAAARAHAHPFGAMIVTTDAHAACVGAHGDRDGGIIVIGTGTIGWGRLRGRSFRVGGWGFPVSDEGSGAWIGCEAVRRVLWACDGRIPWSNMLRAIFEGFGSDPHEIVRWMSTATPREFGMLARTVVRHAMRDDRVAAELMRDAARHIDSIAARLRSFGIARIASVGGLAVAMEPWLSPETRSALVRPAGDALEGALRIAGAFSPAAALTG